MSKTARNLTGQRFGMLVVGKRVPPTGAAQDVHWECKCDCGATKVARTYCLVNDRVRNCGCSNRGGNQHTPVALRFWRNVDKREDDECWLWKGGRARGDGQYGTLTVSGRVVRAHRHSYEMHNGPIPDGFVVDHLCSVKLCVNPRHLEAVTTEENTRRWAEKILAPELDALRARIVELQRARDEACEIAKEWASEAVDFGNTPAAANADLGRIAELRKVGQP